MTNITSAELVSALQVVRDREGLRNKLERLKRTAVVLKEIAGIVTNKTKYLTVAVESLDPPEEKMQSLKRELSRVQNTWEDQTKNAVLEWSIHSDSISFHAIDMLIDDLAQLKAKELLSRASAMAKICSLLEELDKLKNKFVKIRDNIVSSIDDDLDEGQLKKLKDTSGKVDALIEEAKGLGADSDLMAFLEEASSEAGVSLEKLSEKILKLLDQHKLLDLLQAKLGKSRQ